MLQNLRYSCSRCLLALWRVALIFLRITAMTVSCESGYVITTSKYFMAGSSEMVCISLTELRADVTLHLIDARSPHFPPLAVNHTDRPITSQACLQLQVPRLDAGIRLALRAMVAGTETGGVPFSDTSEKPILFMTPTIETFVQTDKPVYKAGQVVKIRVLSLLYPSMRPYTDRYNEVYITTPEDIRVRQWRDIETQEGLIDLTMQLSGDPVLGTWTIHTSVEDGDVTTQSFEIDEYVLPKFDVIISPPSYISVVDEGVQFSVCGLYTYGQPVRGSIAVNASIERTEDLVQLSVEDTGEDGCHTFDVPLSSFSTRRLNQEKYFIIDVNFTETATGVSRNGTHGSTKITYKPLTLYIIGPDGFKPGLPYRCQVVAKLPNGLPAQGKELTVTTRTTENGDVTTSQTVVTDDSGYVNVAVPSPSDPLLTELILKVSYRSPDPQFPLYSGIKSLDAWYSPTGSFLAIRPIAETATGILDAELEFILPVTDAQDIIEFTYNVFANRNLLSAGTHAWSPGSGPTESVQRPRYPGLSQEPTTTRKSSTVRETIDPPNLSPYPDAIRALTSIPITVTSNMAPEATVLVYFTRRDGEVVSAQQDFKVKLAFENDVSLEFNTEQVYPGSPVLLNIHASPGSLCAISSVDKSVLLMEESNRITKEKVFEPMSALALDISGSNSTCPHVAHHRERRRSPPRFPYGNPRYYGPPRTHTTTRTWSEAKHLDAIASFKVTGAEVLTNFQLENRPCYEYATHTETTVRIYPYFNRRVPISSPGVVHHSAPVRHFGLPGLKFGMVPNVEVDVDVMFPSVQSSGPIYQLRTHFPETWLWHLSRIGDQGVASVSHTVPHAITDWVTTGFCTSAETGVGVAEPVSLTVFQPFFVSTTLPYSVIREEEFPLKVTVFNYLTQCFSVAVHIEPTSYYSVTGGNFTQYVCICGNQAESVDFNIIPGTLGQIPIKVMGEYVPPDRHIPPCGNFAVIIPELLEVWDAVNKSVLVEAEGSKVERTKSMMICPDGTNGEPKEISFELPQKVVAGTGSCKVQITGNVLGPVLTNLGSLLRMPTGCGEQNMIGFTPNIFVLMYLDRTNQREALPGQYEKAKEHMEIGYERELHYRRSDGSYSAFGQRDSDGSTWLTAFVLKSFALASEFIDIDTNDLEVTRNWLVNDDTQDSDNGCFLQRGRVIHKNMQGGHTNGVTLSAYVTIALLEAGEPATSMVMFRAVFCLVQALNSGIDDTYTLALVTYALTKAGVPYYTIGLEELNRRAIDGDSTRHWLRSDVPSCDGSDSCKADPAEIEMTAYVLLTYLEMSEEEPQILLNASLVVKWLNEQRNSHGGFTSTQDTVIGLQALALYAEKVYNENKDLRLSFFTTEGNLQEERCHVTAENDLVMREFDINQCPNNLRVFTEGEGCVLFQAISSFNLHVKRLTQSYFDVEVQPIDYTLTQDCSAVYLDINITYVDPVREYTNMAVVDIKMVSGYSVDTEQLDRYLEWLYQTGQDIGLMRYDHFQPGKPFALYFNQFGREPTSFTLVLKRDIHVKSTKDAYIKVFDYYEGGVVTYESYHPCK